MPLNGIWYNELGSEMRLEVDGASIKGRYRTAVGHAAGEYEVLGLTDTKPLPRSQAVAFIVMWSDGARGASVTAWSGQYQVIAGEETITTTWLLTLETLPNADWASTIVGTDVFKREKPSADLVARRAMEASWSHPAA